MSPETAQTALDRATRDAGLAQERYFALEHAAITADEDNRPTGAQVIAAKHEAELANRRIEVAQERLKQAIEETRAAGLDAVGADVLQLAAESNVPSAEQVAAVRQIAEGSAAIRAGANMRDQRVVGLRDRAEELFGGPDDVVKRTGQPGTWAPHMPPMGVRYANVEVHTVRGGVEDAIAAAVRGDVTGALDKLKGVRDHTPPQPTAWYKDTLGQFPPEPVYGRMARPLALMVHDGRAVQMTDDEVAEWKTSRR